MFRVDTVYLVTALPPRGTSETSYLDSMVDLSQADKVTFYITSSLNEPISIQVVGSQQPSGKDVNALVNVGLLHPIPKGNEAVQRIAVSVNLLDYWHKFLGVAIVTGVAPTSGDVGVIVSVRNGETAPGPSQISSFPGTPTHTAPAAHSDGHHVAATGWRG